MGEMNIIESRLAPGNTQVGVELLDRFPIDRGMGGVNVSLRLRTRPCSRDLKGHIRRTRNRIFEAGERRGRRDVYVVQIHMCRVGTVLAEMPVLQDRTQVE